MAFLGHPFPLSSQRGYAGHYVRSADYISLCESSADDRGQWGVYVVCTIRLVYNSFTIFLTINDKMFIKILEQITNHDITKLAKELKIKNFRGVFMRDTLPNKVSNKECGIVNLYVSKNNGIHWVCYYNNNEVFLF